MGRPRKVATAPTKAAAPPTSAEVEEDVPEEATEEKLKLTGLKDWEERLWADDFHIVAGTDEAGRGPLAGPVVAASFAILDRDDEEVRKLLVSVTDSKKMTIEQRDAAFEQLTSPGLQGKVAWSIAEASVAEIDDRNILRASLCAISRSAKALEPKCDYLLVDGCNRPPELLKPGDRWTRGSKKDAEADKGLQKISAFFKPKAVPVEANSLNSSSDFAAVKGEFVGGRVAGSENIWRPCRVEAVIEGDGRVPSISAASILAKVHRDRVMDKLHAEFPAYGFDSHRGYGTESHLEAIRTHGVCPHHRRSFAPIKEALEKGSTEISVAAPAQACEVEQPTTKETKASKAEQPTKETPPKRSQAKASAGSGKRGQSRKSGSTPVVSEQPPQKSARLAAVPVVTAVA